ncbi:hypothetical protein RJ639_033343 [Escallonia herrerae]|uniref:Integrase zinc-binding domain-containing protein n=1 Tax=Escallonia herrerae TaxID=1293975 RepID=A0AA89BAW0_9ASTE|nr:hypothetical protein RJ639_033343 [Escallonia herrerae]
MSGVATFCFVELPIHMPPGGILALERIVFIPKKERVARGSALSQNLEVRWQELLAEFNFMLEYRAGSTNSVANALSRRAELDQIALMAMNASFWQEDGLLMTKGRRVYVPIVDDLRRTLIRECHDILWAGHAEGERTLALLQQGYYWPQIGDEVQEYVKTCLTCQHDKVERKKKAGLLQSLPVPKRPWESVIGSHHWSAEG